MPPVTPIISSHRILRLSAHLRLSPDADDEEIADACDAAHVLRLAIAKEIDSVAKFVAARDEGSEGIDFGIDDPGSEDLTSLSNRTVFMQACELNVIESIVVPTLLRYHHAQLLLECLKLSAAMITPIPGGSVSMSLQAARLASMRAALGEDQFLSMVVRAVAPIAAKRLEKTQLAPNDASLFETFLVFVVNLLKGPARQIESVVGAVCRAQCMELLLVALHQNQTKLDAFARTMGEQREGAVPSPPDNEQDEELQHEPREDGQVIADPEENVDDEAPMTASLELPIEQQQDICAANADQDCGGQCRPQDQLPAIEEEQPAHNAPVEASPVAVTNAGESAHESEQKQESAAADDEPKVREVQPNDDELNWEADLPNASAAPLHQGEASEEEEEVEEEVEEEDVELSVDSSEEEQTADDAVLKQLLAERDAELCVEVSRWNYMILEAVALTFRVAPPGEMALLSCLGHREVNRRADAEVIRAQEDAKAQKIEAHRRGGPLASSSLLVKRHSTAQSDAQKTIVGRASVALGAVTCREVVTAAVEQDKRKRGRYRRKPFAHSSKTLNLPLPTQLLLATQFSSFVKTGLTCISSMLWPELRRKIREVEETVRVGVHARVQERRAGIHAEEGPLLASELETTELGDVFNYFVLCTCSLRFTREVVKQIMRRRQHSDSSGSSDSDSHSVLKRRTSTQLVGLLATHWQGIVCLMSIDHFESGFEILQSLLSARELSARYDACIVAQYLSELIFMLCHMMDGDIARDESVLTAANGVAAALLYKPEHMKCIFSLVSTVTFRGVAHRNAESFFTLLFAAMQLVDRVAFDGSLPDVGASLMDFYVRLTSAKHIFLFRQVLQEWRLNSEETNDALAYFLRRFHEPIYSCHNAFFSVHFLLPMADILCNAGSDAAAESLAFVSGNQELFNACDAIVRDFFNPKIVMNSDSSGESNAFEVAMRCARGLFFLTAHQHQDLDEMILVEEDDALAVPYQSDADGDDRDNESDQENGVDFDEKQENDDEVHFQKQDVPQGIVPEHR